MDENYETSTSDVKASFVFSVINFEDADYTRKQAGAGFDAWLDRVRARTWDEACWYAAPSDTFARAWQKQNPYRAD